MDYKARFYDPTFARFIQPDTIVLSYANPQSLNRFSYVLDSPIRYNDMDGHEPGNCYDRGFCTDERDLTDWLIAALVDSAESPEMKRIYQLNSPPKYDGIDKAKAYAEFNSYVRDGAKYDVKDKMLAAGLDPIKIGGKWYEYSTAGNVLYGFYGKAAGFSAFELHAGAGKAQLDDYNRDPTVGKGNLLTLFDTEDDYAAVGFGIYLYDNYYQSDKQLTSADLMNALGKYRESSKMALRDQPGNFRPMYHNYPANHFYQMQ